MVAGLRQAGGDSWVAHHSVKRWIFPPSTTARECPVKRWPAWRTSTTACTRPSASTATSWMCQLPARRVDLIDPDNRIGIVEMLGTGHPVHRCIAVQQFACATPVAAGHTSPPPLHKCQRLFIRITVPVQLTLELKELPVGRFPVLIVHMKAPSSKSQCKHTQVTSEDYIRNTPNFASGMGAFRLAERPSAITRRVSTGSITPSSQSRALA